MKKLDIIYEDKYLIAINKQAGMLSIADNKNHKNLYHEVREYIKKQNPHNKIFIVHRLDKDTSGVIVFAKDERVKRHLQDNWNNFLREYIGVVENKPKNVKDKLVNYLKEDKNLNVYITNDEKNGKKAITNYEVIGHRKKESVLKINIETGRKNQIRAQLSYIGCPIVGDKKYGAKTNPYNRLCLHANRLVIFHPVLKKEIELVAMVPFNLDFLTN